VLVHGDGHGLNALRSSTGFKLIDPDGLFAERAYDLAIPLREWSVELLGGDALAVGRERCAQLGRLTGVDTEAIWQWAFVERVSTGLLLLSLEAEQLGREMLAVAEAWVE
jgi:streptomycin 6-kinase